MNSRFEDEELGRLKESVFPAVSDILFVRRSAMHGVIGPKRQHAFTSILIDECQVGGFARWSQGILSNTENCILRIGEDLLEFQRRKRRGAWCRPDGTFLASSCLTLMQQITLWGTSNIHIFDLDIQLRMPLVGPSFHQTKPCFLSVRFGGVSAEISLEAKAGDPQMLFPGVSRVSFATLPREVVLVLVGEALRVRSLYSVP